VHHSLPSVVQCYGSTLYTPTSPGPAPLPLCVDVELIELSSTGFAACLSVTTRPRGVCAGSAPSGYLRGFFFNATAFGVPADVLFIDADRFELPNGGGFVPLQQTCTAPPADKPLQGCGGADNAMPATPAWENRLDFGLAMFPGTVAWTSADAELGCVTIRSRGPDIKFRALHDDRYWPVGIVAGGMGPGGAGAARCVGGALYL
jgi:hypothetical protein